MFSSMLGPLSLIITLAVIVMLVAVLSEGRGRHILRLVLGIRPRQDVDQILAPVPRPESDWSLVAQVDARRDRPAPGTRAAAWAKETTAHAIIAIDERATQLRRSGEEAAQAAIEPPRTGELRLARQ